MDAVRGMIRTLRGDRVALLAAALGVADILRAEAPAAIAGGALVHFGQPATARGTLREALAGARRRPRGEGDGDGDGDPPLGDGDGPPFRRGN